MKRLVLLPAFALLPFAVAVCGPSARDAGKLRDDHCPVGGCVDAASTSTGPITIPPEPLEPWDTQGAGPISGIFAVEATIKAHAGPEVEIRQLLRLRIVQQGSHIHQKATLCAFKLPDIPGTATLVIPPALQDVIQHKSTESEGDFLVMGSVIKYVPPPFLIVVGAKLQNEATDPLPTQTDLTNAVDEDHDGNPGVTLGATVFTCTSAQRLYVALRTTGKLAGQISTNDLITGKVDVTLAENVLGYSDDCLSAAAMLKIDVEPASPFTAKRTFDEDDIDRNGNVSCPEIILRAPTTFGPYWAQN